MEDFMSICEPEPHSVKVLEWGEVKEMLASYATWEMGKEAVLDLSPLPGRREILARQQEVTEASQVMEKEGGFPFGGLKDLRKILDVAKIGSVLEPGELLEARTLLAVSRSTRAQLEGRQEYPALSGIASHLAVFRDLERDLQRCIDNEGNILDSASEDLREVRQRIRSLSNHIQHKLATFIRDPQYQKMLQEPLFTLREDRYVIPIKQEYRTSFPGLVLDTSASGATVFMEPFFILEAGNDLREARIREKREIEAVLRRLSGEVGARAQALEENLETLAHLDMLGALGTYLLKSEGTQPAINENEYLRLVGARHPLLKGEVVPIDLEMGREFNTLIITGPNTGGKTVTLKTVGLFAIMALSGVPVPGKTGTEIAAFSRVFADIGDEQSISQNLSTFSAHLVQIIKILKAADAGSLVLLDELGAGTDPAEGAVLGVALLENLTRRGCRTIATTHYGELKVFGANFPGVRNAAVEFDVETLKPTYKVSIGMPGRSCALAIARRLDLPEGIVERARSLLSRDHIAMEELLSQLQLEKERFNRKLDDLRLWEKRIEELKTRYEEGLSRLEEDRLAVLTRAVGEAEALLGKSRKDVQDLLREFRRRLAGIAQKGKSRKTEAESAVSETLTEMEKILKRIEQFREERNIPAEEETPEFREGDYVYIPRFSSSGQVLSCPEGGDVQVMVGNVKMTLPVRELKPVAPPRQEESRVEEFWIRRPALASNRLDLRGYRVDEALDSLGKFLDEADFLDFPSLRIIHGKGTGKLMKAVHQFLRSHPKVADFRLGEYFEGSWGVTIVRLKRG